MGDDGGGHGEAARHARSARSGGRVTVHPLLPAPTGMLPAPVDGPLIDLLEASFRVTAERADELADRFYARLFELHPDLRRMFPADMGEQKVKLLKSLEAVIAGLRTPRELREKLRELGRLHEAKGVREEHYAPVCAALLWAMRSVSGSAWTPTLEAEWDRALKMISAIMVGAS